MTSFVYIWNLNNARSVVKHGITDAFLECPDPIKSSGWKEIYVGSKACFRWRSSLSILAVKLY